MERDTLHTTADAARQLGVTPRRVRALAQARGVGVKVGRDYVFRDADLDAMRVRRNGRPPRG